MKVSLAWLKDHIIQTCDECKAEEVVAELNKKTAEVEAWHRVRIPWERIFCGRLDACESDRTQVFCFETQQTVTLPGREGTNGAYYFFVHDDSELRWATYSDIGGDHDDELPHLLCTQQEAHGGWRSTVEYEDVIIEIDNTSLTHRPDLWGHRGLARELCAIFGYDLVPAERLCATIASCDVSGSDVSGHPIVPRIDKDSSCTRFSLARLDGVARGADQADICIMQRLARMGARSHGCLVDATNYVLHDWGHPMHAFDAQQLTGDELIARPARSGESLAVLDGDTLELESHDTVIADSQHAVSLAGIMGGAGSAVSDATQSVVLEAACFEKYAIRKTSARQQKRTDSSARFEKGLDPYQTISAIQRYVALVQRSLPHCTAAAPIVSAGTLPESPQFRCAHTFLEQRLGRELEQKRVTDILVSLGFCVEQTCADGVYYDIGVPTFRATGDVETAVDIVEEVGRCVGYETLSAELPPRPMEPLQTDRVRWRHALKRHCAHALAMTEVCHYALYDQGWIDKIGYTPQQAVALRNPLSQQWQVLVTSLVPHILKGIAENIPEYTNCRFFEWGRCWHRDCEANDAIVERRMCCGAWYDKNGVDFFRCKTQLQSLFSCANVRVTWHAASKSPACGPWYDPDQTAELYAGEAFIGYAGMLTSSYTRHCGPGDIFVFEVDLDALYNAPRCAFSYTPIAKYQPVRLDVSMFVDPGTTVAELEKALQEADARVQHVALHDVFKEDAWQGVRSLNFRCTVQDPDKTLERTEIDAIQKALYHAAERAGGRIR